MRSPYGGLVIMMLFSFGCVKFLKSACSTVITSDSPAALTLSRAVLTAFMSMS